MAVQCVWCQRDPKVCPYFEAPRCQLVEREETMIEKLRGFFKRPPPREPEKKKYTFTITLTNGREIVLQRTFEDYVYDGELILSAETYAEGWVEKATRYGVWVNAHTRYAPSIISTISFHEAPPDD